MTSTSARRRSSPVWKAAGKSSGFALSHGGTPPKGPLHSASIGSASALAFNEDTLAASAGSDLGAAAHPVRKRSRAVETACRVVIGPPFWHAYGGRPCGLRCRGAIATRKLPPAVADFRTFLRFLRWEAPDEIPRRRSLHA